MLTRSPQPQDMAFLDGSIIFLPFGNTTNRRTSGPSLSTTYLVPSGKRLGSRDALRTWLAPLLLVNVSAAYQAILFVRIVA